MIALRVYMAKECMYCVVGGWAVNERRRCKQEGRRRRESKVLAGGKNTVGVVKTES